MNADVQHRAVLAAPDVVVARDVGRELIRVDGVEVLTDGGAVDLLGAHGAGVGGVISCARRRGTCRWP